MVLYMRRLQIQLDDATYEALRHRAFEGRQSLAATIRELLGHALTPQQRKRKLRLEDFTFIGSFASGSPNRVSEEHDEVLGEGRW